MLSALRRAAGEPVSFSELREAGVEFPASIVSELELAGIPIERCRGAGGRGAAVRLVPDAEASPESVATQVASPESVATQPVSLAPPEPEPEPARPKPARTRAATPPRDEDWTRIRRYHASNRDGLLLALIGSKRLLAPLALGIAIAVVALIVVTGIGNGAGPTRTPSHATTRAQAKAPTTTHASQATTSTTAPPTTTSTPPTPVSLTLATQLESQGHDLLESSQYTQAVAVLRRAVAATGENVNACTEPQSTMCLTYAYALYDLGRALRLGGDPAAAVPILEARLQIDNQRPTVLAELQLARQGAT